MPMMWWAAELTSSCWGCVPRAPGHVSYLPSISLSVFRKMLRKELAPSGLYLRLNLSNRQKVDVSACIPRASRFRLYGLVPISSNAYQAGEAGTKRAGECPADGRARRPRNTRASSRLGEGLRQVPRLWHLSKCDRLGNSSGLGRLLVRDDGVRLRPALLLDKAEQVLLVHGGGQMNVRVDLRVVGGGQAYVAGGARGERTIGTSPSGRRRSSRRQAPQAPHRRSRTRLPNTIAQRVGQ